MLQARGQICKSDFGVSFPLDTAGPVDPRWWALGVNHAAEMKATWTKDSKASLWFLLVIDPLEIHTHQIFPFFLFFFSPLKPTIMLLLVSPLKGREMMSSFIVSDSWNAGHLSPSCWKAMKANPANLPVGFKEAPPLPLVVIFIPGGPRRLALFSFTSS